MIGGILWLRAVPRGHLHVVLLVEKNARAPQERQNKWLRWPHLDFMQAQLHGLAQTGVVKPLGDSDGPLLQRVGWTCFREESQSEARADGVVQRLSIVAEWREN